MENKKRGSRSKREKVRKNKSKKTKKKAKTGKSKEVKNKKTGKLIIFDFDGTIVDTKSLYYHVIYQELKRFGFSYKRVDSAIDLGMTLKKTLGKLGFSFLTSWYLKKKIMNKVKENIDNIKKCEDIDDISKLKGGKIIVSNSSKDMIKPVLKHLKLKSEFKEIYGSEDFNDKTSFIKKYLKEHNIDKKQIQDCYYIGDRAADVKLAKKVGCIGIAIIGKCAWDSRKELLSEQPDFVVHSLKDLEKVIK
jgi:phosphoglycolate phosphatase-like HAD superfamily hydrolase